MYGFDTLNTPPIILHRLSPCILWIHPFPWSPQNCTVPVSPLLIDNSPSQDHVHCAQSILKERDAAEATLESESNAHVYARGVLQNSEPPESWWSNLFGSAVWFQINFVLQTNWRNSSRRRISQRISTSLPCSDWTGGPSGPKRVPETFRSWSKTPTHNFVRPKENKKWAGTILLSGYPAIKPFVVVEYASKSIVCMTSSNRWSNEKNEQRSKPVLDSWLPSNPDIILIWMLSPCFETSASTLITPFWNLRKFWNLL